MSRKKRGSPSPSQPGPLVRVTTSAPAVAPRHNVRLSFTRWSWLVPPLLILAAGIAAYANSFAGSFLFDDERAIVDAPATRQLWPFPGAPLPGPRSLVMWTLALNYAVGGLHVWGYHAFNLLVHLLAGLTLYGLVLGTLSLPSLQARYGCHARWLALAVALIWVVHPLQTESVTYIIQRAEAMVSLFYLLTFFCLLHAVQDCRLRWGWYAGCVLCCALGMLCKEVMCTAPLLVLLYDRIFLATSWVELLRRRALLYLGLAATLIILAPSLTNAFVLPPASRPAVAPTGPEAKPATSEHFPISPESDLSAGFGMASLSWQQYARTQPRVILHYLRLAFWPDSLCLNYGWPVADPVAAIVPCVLVGGLVLLALIALFRWQAVGFVGAWFFLILAPTSTIMPIADLAVEHRIYLALAAPVLLVVLAGEWALRNAGRRFGSDLSRRAGLVGLLLAAVVLPLGWRTIERNKDYYHPIRMWSVTAEQRPNNARVHASLGRYLTEHGDLTTAERHCRLALQLRPDYAEAESNLSICLIRLQRLKEAEYHCRTAVRLKPNLAIGWSNLGVCLAMQDRPAEAEEQFRRSLELNGNDAQTHFNLGVCLLTRTRPAEAEEQLRLALRLNPGHAGAHSRLALLLTSQGKTQQALAHFEAAMRLFPDNARAHYNLAVCLTQLGQMEQARQHFQRANQIDPKIRPPE